MIRTIAAAAIATLAVSTATLADDEFKFTFTFDANAINTQLGAEAAYDDLITQAMRACKSSNGRLTLAQRNFQRECAEGLVEEVVSKLDRTALTAVHNDVASPAVFAAARRASVVR